MISDILKEALINSFHGLSKIIPKEPLNKSENYLVRHSGACQTNPPGADLNSFSWPAKRAYTVEGIRNPVKTIVYWMLVWLQTIPGLHPKGVLHTTRFVPDESVTSMTSKILIQSFLNYQSLVLQSTQHVIKLLLVACRLVLVDEPFPCHAIDDRYGCL